MNIKNKGILKFFAGLAIGIGIGFATNSIGIGIGTGIAFGAAFSQGKIVWRNYEKTNSTITVYSTLNLTKNLR